MKKWSFIIRSGYTNYLRGWVKGSMSNDIFFYDEGSDEDANLTYFFSSSHLNHLTEADEVYQLGNQLKLLFDGISYLIYEDPKEYRPIRLGRIINNQTNETFDLDHLEIKNEFSLDFTINKTTSLISRNSLDQLLYLATKDQFILNLLLIFSNGKDFKSMYQALDEIRFLLKSKKSSLKNLGFSNAVIESFTHTANSFSILGKDARHGSQKGEPPRRPMPLVQAQNLILDIVRKVIYEYYKIDIPIQKSFKIDWDEVDFDLKDF